MPLVQHEFLCKTCKSFIENTFDLNENEAEEGKPFQMNVFTGRLILTQR